MTPSSTLEEIEGEILAIFEDCKAQGLSKEEIRDIFSPLGLPNAVNKLTDGGSGGGVKGREKRGQESTPPQSLSPWRKFVDGVNNRVGGGCGWVSKVVGMILLLTLLGAVLHRNEDAVGVKNVRFHALAIIRIALIKMLPYWNWTEMYYTRCLVRNPFFEAPNANLNPDDCNLCESLDEIVRLENVSQGRVLEEYIRREKPFLVTDGMEDWDIMATDQFWFDNITQIYLRQDPYSVCNVNTNLRISNGDFTRLLKRLYNPRTREWFIHWENCQKEMAKGVRAYYRRPYFISDSLDFTGSNWVLMSSDFKGRVYKKLEVRESLSLVYQVRGFNHVRLSPRETCRGHCPELVGTLREGEILVVTNMLWMLEYIPGEEGDNLAFLSEVSWPSME